MALRIRLSSRSLESCHTTPEASRKQAPLEHQGALYRTASDQGATTCASCLMSSDNFCLLTLALGLFSTRSRSAAKLSCFAR